MPLSDEVNLVKLEPEIDSLLAKAKATALEFAGADRVGSAYAGARAWVYLQTPAAGSHEVASAYPARLACLERIVALDPTETATGDRSPNPHDTLLANASAYAMLSDPSVPA
jgi:hypothetical protein